MHRRACCEESNLPSTTPNHVTSRKQPVVYCHHHCVKVHCTYAITRSKYVCFVVNAKYVVYYNSTYRNSFIK